MKWMIILMTVTSMHVSATGFTQTITYAGKEAPLEGVLNAVRQQTGYAILYDAALISHVKPVTISATAMPLDEFLRAVLKPLHLTYLMMKTTIVITEDSEVPGAKEEKPATDPPLRIRGRVVSEKGEPLAGVSIQVKGSKEGTMTNATGDFVLDNVAATAVLVFSGANIETGEYRVNGKQEIIYTAIIKVSKLDQVQVIAYGTTSQRYSVGNVSTVKGEDIVKSPVLNPLQALQGRVPGITIESASGVPGAAISVRVQGQNSLSRGNNPLYVIDGVPYPSSSLPNSQYILEPNGDGRNGTDNGREPSPPGNPLNYIDMNDIESIDVLKDADATSIYGSRAANGAILITTKKGKAGAVKFNARATYGESRIGRMTRMLNLEEYLMVRKEAYQNAGLPVPDVSTPVDYNNADLTLWDQQKYTDWQKTLLVNRAPYINLHANTSGGTGGTQFLVGATYKKQNAPFIGNYSDQSGGMNMNISTATPNQRFKVNAGVQYYVNENKMPRTDVARLFSYLPPNAPDFYNADGTLNWALLPDGTPSRENVMAGYRKTGSLSTNTLLGSGMMSYQLMKGLELRGNFGYNQMSSRGLQTTPLTSFAPHQVPTARRSTAVTTGSLSTWQIEPQLSYNISVLGGKLNVLAGATFLRTHERSQNYYGSGANSDLLLDDLASHPNQFFRDTRYSIYRYNALFGRIGYIWQDKYILSLNGRRDGSSRFGESSALHSFGSVGGGWIFTNEPWLRGVQPVLSFGKLTANYGTSGNDNIGNYQYISLYRVAGNGTRVPYQGTIGLQPVGLPNPYLQWESTRKLSLGLSLGFLNDCILFNPQWYRNRSSNQLTDLIVPMNTGFYSMAANLPATIQNTGLEMTLSTRNISNRVFTWTTDINVTVQRNKLVSFPGIENTFYNGQLIVGKPLNIQRLYHYIGVNPETGLYNFTDVHGNATTSPSPETDATSTFTSFPDFTMGMTNALTYKSIRLDFVCEIVKQRGQGWGGGANPGSRSQQPAYILDRWRKPGDKASIQRYDITYDGEVGNAYNSYQSSDAMYGDASYLRLRNLSLTWTVPARITGAARIQGARIFLQGQNLLTITSYKGLDPERRSNDFRTPVMRTFAAGIDVSF